MSYRDIREISSAVIWLTCSDKIAAARARAEESLRTARLRLSQAGDEVAESARATLDAAHEYARKNPWKALAIAVGMGLLGGLIFDRR